MTRRNLNLELYKKIYLIRRSESSIMENYPQDEMKTPMHMSMGEEAITSGVCQALSREDQVFGTYRSHALYLSKTMETDKFFAEMYGKANGVVKGKGGSMHLLSPLHGLMATSAVVSSTIPTAAGAAFANRYSRNKKVTAAFFGDGAIDEGVFWETLNIACLQKLPIIFVCEDNGFAVHTQTSKRHGYKSISEIVKKFNCKVFTSESTDPEEIYKIASKAKQLIAKNNGPVFLYFKYYRYLEHVGVNWDFDVGYRKKAEFKKWLKKDPLDIQRKKLIKIGVSKTLLIKLEKEIDHRVQGSLELAKRANFPQKMELLRDVYYESK